jgi:AraC-like DNA-binding protein
MNMNYDKFSSDLPLSGMASFSSPEENEEFMSQNGINQHLRQLSSGDFHADYAMLETDQAILTADRFNRECAVYLEPPPDTVALLVFRSAGGRFLASGENVTNDKLVVLPDGYGADLVTPELAGSEGIILHKSKYAELVQVLCPSCIQPEGVAILEGDTRQVHRMRDTVTKIIASMEPSDEEIANLVAQMIIWAGYSSDVDRHEIISSKHAKVRIAKQVQAYVEEHYNENVCIEDLCRATGKEVRTLQTCFRRYFDMTITDYLKTVRLNSAFRVLSSMQAGEATVASVAMQNGFTHLGRFSVEYRKRFGESARKTLLRRNT